MQIMSRPKEAVISTRFHSHSQRKWKWIWKLKMESVDLIVYDFCYIYTHIYSNYLYITISLWLIWATNVLKRQLKIEDCRLQTENGSLSQNVFIQLSYIDTNSWRPVKKHSWLTSIGYAYGSMYIPYIYTIYLDPHMAVHLSLCLILARQEEIVVCLHCLQTLCNKALRNSFKKL